MNECELLEDHLFRLEALITSLYRARQDVIAAREARREVRGRVGSCALLHEFDIIPCWHYEPEKWCEACVIVKPHHDAYRAASFKAGVALRRVLREGKRLVEEQETKT
jgi:hypothetical protein